jgi:diguanylate cyclase (GGDEF)-like protein
VCPPTVSNSGALVMARVLVADDDESTRRELKILLEGAGYDVELAADGHDAMRRAAASTFDLALLDVVMPGVSGLEVCRAMKARAGSAMQPVLLLVPKTDAASRARGLSAGADDWVQKPVDPQALLARVAALVRMKRVHDDVREARSLLERMSARDELTALTNYRSLERELRDLLSQAIRFKEPLAAALFDIDGLETINQRFGRAAGDEGLRMLADAIRARMREGDVAVRYGPDEALLLMPRTNLLAAMGVTDAVWREFDARARPGPTARFAATVSAGVACFPGRDVRDGEALLRAADYALACAKRGGASRVCGFQQHGLLYAPASKGDPTRGSRGD